MNALFHETLTFDQFLLMLQQTAVQIELAVILGCVLVALAWSKRVHHRFFADALERADKILPYLASRIAFPLSAGGLTFLGAVVAQVGFGHFPAFLYLASVTLFWLGVIRVIAAIIRNSLPSDRVGKNSEHVMSTGLWLFYLSHLLGFNAVVSDALRSVSFMMGKTRLDLMMILSGLFWIVLILFITLWLGRLLDQRLMKLNDMDMSLRIVASKALRTLLVVLGILIALPMVGIDLTVLSVFGGALGVGLGFGLQKIASNYVSGFIILLDRSVRVGDRVMVADRAGVIAQITARYVVVRSPDGSDSLVPNESFVANTVVNQSYHDKQLWQSLSIGVAYHTDLPQALALMVEAAKTVERVMQTPAPNAFVVDFADSSIVLTLGYWVADPENGLLGVKSAVNLAIWQAFKDHNIEIPFPQREVKVVNAAELFAAPPASSSAQA